MSRRDDDVFSSEDLEKIDELYNKEKVNLSDESYEGEDYGRTMAYSKNTKSGKSSKSSSGSGLGSDFGGGRRKRRDAETIVVSLIFVAIFATLAIYYAYFHVAIAPTIDNRTYNSKYASSDNKDAVRQGDVYAAGGEVLAETKLDDEDLEYRYYPYDDLFAVPVGYSTSEGGGSGIEYEMFDNLMISSSKEQVGYKASDVEGVEYYGDNVYTTLDVDLQQAAYDALGDESGVVIAIEPSTGKIRAMVSKPTFDANDIMENYEYYSEAGDGILINRATMATYEPGSTFKIFTSLSHVMQTGDNYKKFSFTCSGETQPSGGAKVTCQYHTAHGKQSIVEAFAVSCNCFFSTLGLNLDINLYRQLADEFGLNSKLEVGGLNEGEIAQSSFPLDANSSISEIQNTAYGQGKTQITPLQNLMITATIANGGSMMKPYLVNSVRSSEDGFVSNYFPVVYKNALCTEEEASKVSDLMKNMVETTLSGVFYGDYTVCGKTGQAEYSDTDTDRAHMWFTCFSPQTNPEIAVIAVVEKSEINATKAPTICKKVLDAYYYGY